MNDTPDYSGFEEPRSNNLDGVLIGLADELEAAEALIVQREEELQAAKDAHKDIAEVRVPAATDGLEGKFQLSDGRELTVKEDIRSSIAGDKRVPAIKWLDDHDYGHIVKRELTFTFGKDCDEEIKAFREYMAEMEGKKPPMKENYSVHHATLNSWIKEKMEEGVDLPRDTFGIFRQRVAKVKPKE